MRQWLILTDWCHRVDRYKEGNGMLTISLRFVNRTKSPLDLRGYQFNVQGGVGNGCAVQHTLLPDEPFAVDFGTLVSSEQVNHRDTNGLILYLAGDISFIDVLNSLQRQRFMGLLRCMKGGRTEFTPEGSAIGMPSQKT